VALLVWPSVYAADWESARRVVADNGLGGVLLMKPDGWDAATLRQRLAELDVASPHGLLVATDEEGGDVQRLSAIAPLPSQREISTTMTPEEASVAIGQHAEIVADLGVDIVLAPVVDVLPEDGQPPLDASRFFQGDPQNVGAYGAAYVGAWQRAGILPVLKHFPGHGAASGDTHVGAGETPGIAALEARDLVPYRLLAGTGAAVMVGHLTTPGLSDDVPASRSAPAVAYLREVLGYGDALVVSDALDMGAVGISVPEAAVESVRAGVDVVLFTDPAMTGPVIEALRSAVEDGTLPAERVRDAATKVARLLDEHDASRLVCAP